MMASSRAARGIGVTASNAASASSVTVATSTGSSDPLARARTAAASTAAVVRPAASITSASARPAPTASRRVSAASSRSSSAIASARDPAAPKATISGAARSSSTSWDDSCARTAARRADGSRLQRAASAGTARPAIARPAARITPAAGSITAAAMTHSDGHREAAQRRAQPAHVEAVQPVDVADHAGDQVAPAKAVQLAGGERLDPREEARPDRAQRPQRQIV